MKTHGLGLQTLWIWLGLFHKINRWGFCKLNGQGQGYFTKLMDGVCELNGQGQRYIMKLMDGDCELNKQGQGYFVKLMDGV